MVYFLRNTIIPVGAMLNDIGQNRLMILQNLDVHPCEKVMEFFFGHQILL